MWADGGWRSSYYLASYAAIAYAAASTGLRWAVACGLLLAAGYLGGLVIHGYTWERLNDLRDADSVVANTGGYLIAAYFFAAPVNWFGGYVARINQVISSTAAEGSPQRLRTAELSPREVQVAQLVSEGCSNEAIARALVISVSTVETHINRALKKTKARNRTELAVIAVQEGLIPKRGDPP